MCLCVKYAPDFEDLVFKKKNVKTIDNFYIGYMLK